MSSDTLPPPENTPVILWFRNDLRLQDNLALLAASASGRPVIPLYILEDDAPADVRLGPAQLWWLHHSLDALETSLLRHGARLILRRGPVADVLDAMIAETDATAIHWNRQFAPSRIVSDNDLAAGLRERGLTVEVFDGQLLHDPSRLRSKSGGPFRVYTPFWRTFSAGIGPRPAVSAPDSIRSCDLDIASDSLADWALTPTAPDWAAGLRERWTPGETGAHARLAEFLDAGAVGYREKRDFPGAESTSRLSPHLAFGEITPFQIWHAVVEAGDIDGGDRQKFLQELCWREFSYHLLVNFPDMRERNLNASFDAFPWTGDTAALDAWTLGETGYPIVDAGMRELWQTGWMHNRVRMIVGSFLVKHLLVDWRHGERWFADTLVDRDPASNVASWQWIAGCGADAAPYFRIFNPMLQGQKFDPDGAYVRRFVPELADLPSEHIHQPWTAPAHELDRAGIVLGKTYPCPIVDHRMARDRALNAYQEMKRTAA